MVNVCFLFFLQLYRTVEKMWGNNSSTGSTIIQSSTTDTTTSSATTTTIADSFHHNHVNQSVRSNLGSYPGGFLHQPTNMSDTTIDSSNNNPLMAVVSSIISNNHDANSIENNIGSVDISCNAVSSTGSSTTTNTLLTTTVSSNGNSNNNHNNVGADTEMDTTPPPSSQHQSLVDENTANSLDTNSGLLSGPQGLLSGPSAALAQFALSQFAGNSTNAALQQHINNLQQNTNSHHSSSRLSSLTGGGESRTELLELAPHSPLSSLPPILQSLQNSINNQNINNNDTGINDKNTNNDVVDHVHHLHNSPSPPRHTSPSSVSLDSKPILQHLTSSSKVHHDQDGDDSSTNHLHHQTPTSPSEAINTNKFHHQPTTSPPLPPISSPSPLHYSRPLNQGTTICEAGFATSNLGEEKTSSHHGDSPTKLSSSHLDDTGHQKMVSKFVIKC